MHTTKPLALSKRRGVGALLASLIASAALLVGAAGAQANPSDAIDFLFDVDAKSATFTPITGKPGLYQLVLRGVPNQVGVSELNASETTATLSTKHLMMYWTEYGDETGQFDTNAPRAVLRPKTGTDEVVVRLRDGSRTGSTLRFEAEIITRPRVQNVLDKKIEQIVETATDIAPDPEPTAMAHVDVYVDMPNRIAQPELPTTDTAAKSTVRAATPATRARRCNGIYSSRLVQCWNEIGTYPENVGGWYQQIFLSPPAPFIAFNNVGLVDLGGYWFSPAAYALIYPQLLFVPSDKINWIIGFDRTRNLLYWREGDYYGVSPKGVTLFASDDCTWFMKKWVQGGRCW